MTPRTALILAALACAAGSGAVHAARRALRDEVARLAQAREEARTAAGDALLSVEVDRIRLALERARSDTTPRAVPHLALALGDGWLTLERGSVVLRAADAFADVPRGIHAVETVGRDAIVLTDGIRLVAGGTATPAGGRVIRIPRVDFDAIRPNVSPGLQAFFF